MQHPRGTSALAEQLCCTLRTEASDHGAGCLVLLLVGEGGLLWPLLIVHIWVPELEGILEFRVQFAALQIGEVTSYQARAS